MTVLAFVLAGLALVAWSVAFISWVLVVANRRPEVPLSHFLLRGFFAMRPENLTEAGVAHRGRFVVSALAFFGCLLGVMGVVLVGLPA